MKFTHKHFSSPINFNENEINILVLENPIIFSKMIREILKQCEGYEGNFILSENFELIEIKNNILVVTDIFNININDKKILNKIYNNLKEISSIDMFEQTQNLNAEIVKYLQELIQFTDYPLVYNEDISLENIFKSCNLKIESLNDSILEDIINYITLYKMIFKTKLFIFVNLRSALSQDELFQLYKTVSYEKINILLIETNITNIINEYEKIRIIDNDMCEIF